MVYFPARVNLNTNFPHQREVIHVRLALFSTVVLQMERRLDVGVHGVVRRYRVNKWHVSITFSPHALDHCLTNV